MADAVRELDYRYLDTFGVALTESMRLDRNPYLNLTGLDYIDAACATAVVQAAGQLPRSRHVTIACRGLVRTVLDLVGAGTADRIRMRPRNDQS